MLGFVRGCRTDALVAVRSGMASVSWTVPVSTSGCTSASWKRASQR